MTNVLAVVPEQQRDIRLLRGYIEAMMERDADAAHRWLDAAITDAVLAPLFPELQASASVGERGGRRLLHAITIGIGDVWRYKYLGLGGVADSIPSSIYRQFLSKLVDVEDGYSVAVELAWMRLHPRGRDNQQIDAEMLGLFRDLLLRLKFADLDANVIYKLKVTAEISLRGPSGQDAAARLCAAFVTEFSDYQSGYWRYGDLIEKLFTLQPEIALDAFVAPGSVQDYKPQALHFADQQKSPLANIPPTVLLEWANKDPANRMVKLAHEVPLFESDLGKPQLSSIVRKLLEPSPDRQLVLDALTPRFVVWQWTGEYAMVVRPQLCVLEDLQAGSDPGLSVWATQIADKLRLRIESEERSERASDEAFE
jgi:hypothetical protein